MNLNIKFTQCIIKVKLIKYRENKILKIGIENRINKPACKWNYAKCIAGESSSFAISITKKKPPLTTVLINIPKKSCIYHELFAYKSILMQKLRIAIDIKEFHYQKKLKQKKIRKGIDESKTLLKIIKQY